MTGSRYAAALSQHPVAPQAVGELGGAILERLDGEQPDLVVCFLSPHFAGAADDIAAALRRILEPGVLIGCTAAAVIAGSREVEDAPALAAWAAHLPDATLVPVGLAAEVAPDGIAVTGWPALPHEPATLLLLGDPYSFPMEPVLRRLGDDRPGLQVMGGMASAAVGPGGNRLLLDDDVRIGGAVGVALTGSPRITAVVSQGCRPVGRAYVVTDADESLVRALGGRPALDRLQELAAAMPEEERALLARGLHVGLVVDEHREEFGRGDFLVRNVVGARREDGAIAVGGPVQLGQTLQFHVRDADAADEDLRVLLTGRRADAALLFTCTGRGRRLFGTDDHDAGLVDRLLGPLPLAGAFCAGELGPVGGRNHVHGFTASVALFEEAAAHAG